MRPNRAAGPLALAAILLAVAPPVTAHDPAATVQPPILHDGHVIAVNGDGWVRGLDPETGVQRWAVNLGEEPLGPAVAAGSVVAVPTWDPASMASGVVGVARDGARWSVRLPAFPLLLSAGPDDGVLAVTPDGNVTFIGSDGSTPAIAHVEGAGPGATVYDGSVVMVPTSDGRVVVLSADLADVLDTIVLGDNRVKHVVPVEGGFLATVRSGARQVDIVARVNGSEAWRATVPGFQFGSAPAVNGGVVAGGNFDPNGASVYYWNLTTGHEIAVHSREDTAAAVRAHSNGFVELWNDALIRTNADGEVTWTLGAGGKLLAAPSVLDRMTIPGTATNSLTAYGPDGETLWTYEDDVTIAPWQDAHGGGGPAEDGSPGVGSVGAVVAMAAALLVARRRR